LQSVAGCCRVLQCVAGFCCSCCSVWQCVLQTPFSPAIINIAIILPACFALQCVAVCCSVLQCVAGCSCSCCSVLQYVAVCCGVLQCDTVCCRVLLCVAVCCRVLQCVVACRSVCCRNEPSASHKGTHRRVSGATSHPGRLAK